MRLSGANHDLILSDMLDSDGDCEISIDCGRDDCSFYINSDDAREIVAHLSELFGLYPDRLGGEE